MTNNLYEIDSDSSSSCSLKSGDSQNTSDIITINKYVLDELKKEYIDFSHNRDILIGILKENGKNSINILDKMKMSYLEKYIIDTCDSELTSKLQFSNQFKCELCNYYICNNRKSLSAHQRGCKKYIGSL
jgi:hypothetical protein